MTADAARQSSFDGSLRKVGREERERDRHIDPSTAALNNVVGGGNDGQEHLAVCRRLRIPREQQDTALPLMV